MKKFKTKKKKKKKKKKGKTIIPYILIFIFLDSKLEVKRFCTDRQQELLDFSLFLISHE